MTKKYLVHDFKNSTFHQLFVSTHPQMGPVSTVLVSSKTGSFADGTLVDIKYSHINFHGKSESECYDKAEAWIRQHSEHNYQIVEG